MAIKTNATESINKAAIESFEANRISNPRDLPYDLTNADMGSVYGLRPEIPVGDEEPKAGLFETAYLGFKEYGIWPNAYQSLKQTGLSLYYLQDDVPDNFNTEDPDLYKNIPPEYWPDIREAVSPNDLKARQARIQEEIYNKQRFEDGSAVGGFIGGALGVTVGSYGVGISKWFLPSLSTLRTGKIAQDTLSSVVKALPNIALDSLAYEGGLQLSKMQVDLPDLAVNTVRDTIFGAALSGFAKATGYGLDNMKIWNARKVMNMEYEGSTINPVFENGEITGYDFVPGEKIANNAQKVKEAKIEALNMVSESGLYSVPGLGKVLKKGSMLASPVFRGLSSDFQFFRDFVNNIADHGIRTTEELLGFARPDSAESILSYYRATATKFSGAYLEHYYAANGLTSSLQTVNAVKNMTQAFTEKKAMSYEEFGRRVRNVIIKDIPDEVSSINLAAKDFQTIMEKVNEEYAKAHGIDKFLSPRNAANYIFQNYNLDKLHAEPDGFYELVSNHLKTQYDLVKELKAPINDINKLIKKLDEEISKATDLEAEQLDIQKNILLEKRAQAQEELNKTLTDNEEYHFLLEDRVHLSSSERIELKKLLDSGLDKNALNSMARSGKINQKFFTLRNDEIVFRDPNGEPSFVKTYATKKSRMNAAYSLRQSILGNSPMALTDAVLGHGIHPGMERPIYTKERSVLIPQEVLNDAGYLDNDLTKSMHAYMGSMGKRIGLKKAFKESYGIDGLKGLLNKGLEEYKAKEAEILKKPSGQKRNKELSKLKKEYNNAVSDITAMYDIYHGRYDKLGSSTTSQGLHILRNLAYSTKLGALPIAQLTDITSSLLRTGFIPWLTKGVIPHLKTLNKMLKTKDAKILKESAAKSLLALNHVSSNLQNSWFHSNSMSYESKLGKLVKASEWLAHKSSNFSFANAIENINESIAERSFQSDIMKACHDYLAGKATKAQKIQMARIGIQLEEDARPLVDQFNKYGGTSSFNGLAYDSNYQNWLDADLQQRMVMSVRRGVSDVVVKRQLFSGPLLLNNPIMGTLFMFNGWAFAATGRYLIPTMQSADSKALLGFLAMSAVSVWQEPLRRIVNGKDAFTDEDDLQKITLQGVMQNGFFGILPSAVEGLNLAFHNELIPKLQGERYKDRNLRIGGAGIDYVNDVFNLLGMAYSGKINQNDVKRSARLLPFIGNFYIRGLINQMIDGLEIPETRAEAEPWSFKEE